MPTGLALRSLLGDLESEAAKRAASEGRAQARRWVRREARALAIRYAWARATKHLIASETLDDVPRDSRNRMSSLLQDALYGIRSLRSTPGTTAAVVGVLVLGIGSFAAAFSLAEAGLLSASPFPDGDRLVVAETTFNGRPNPVGSAQDWADYQARSTSFEQFGTIMPFYVPVSVVAEREPVRADHIYVSWNLFPMLRAEPHLGRVFREEDAQVGTTTVIVSHRFWQQQLGGAHSAIGRAIRVDGVAHTVVGVMPVGFHFLLDVDLWRPMQIGGAYASERRFHNWLMVGRLADGMSLTRAQSDVDVISGDLRSEYPDSNASKSLSLIPLADWMASSVRTPLLLILATASLVLVAAGSNVASLLLSRSSARHAELAIRSALGATRGRIIQQLVVESQLLGIAASAGGLLLAGWLRSVLLSVVPLSLFGVTDLHWSPVAVGMGIGMALLVSLVAGVAPAIRRAVGGRAQAMGSERTTTGDGNRVRSTLVVAQVAVATVLLVGSALLLQSFWALSSRSPGFEPRRVLTAEVNLRGSQQESSAERRVFYESMAERIETLPAVESVALATHLPIRNPGNNIGVWNPDAPAEPGQRPLAYQRVVRPGYFETMRIGVLEGRGLQSGIGEPVEFVISRSLADRLFPSESAVGRRMGVDWGENAEGPIVGVVADVRLNELSDGAAPTFYASLEARAPSALNLAVRTRGDDSDVLSDIRGIIRELDATVPLADVRWMDDLIADSIGQPRLLSVAMGMFATTALVLSVVGLYGLLAQAVLLRRREFGLRVAVGASSRDVLRIVLRSGMGRICTGLLIGIGAAGILSRGMESVLFEVSTLDPVTYAAVAGVLAVVGFAACAIPAWRATRLDPVVALRAE